ncbi:DUF1707 domain-containing protein [Paraferrimonas sp. SM1919]|uniref:DUF1707 domain-containing protein n=1 Tax=Paraferrimonas sp. SM1919 TaxID=2662263 RepID=UPI0013D6CFBA|nr:DUF1707 domain-containing protein [Paraferrimonas sp. SM1919]
MVAIKDRPTAKVRQEVIDKLIVNYSHGELSEEAFERRLDQATALEDNEQLMALVQDLPREAEQSYAEMQANMDSSKTTLAEDYTEIKDILSDNKHGGPQILPKQLGVTSVLAHTTLDLREAVFAHPELHIELFCALSECHIILPENVRVVSSVQGLLSSITNKSIGHESGPVIRISGKSYLSTFSAKVKKPVKQQWLDMAKQLKQGLFGSGNDV